MMELKTFNSWEAEGFTKIISFKSSVQSHLLTYFPESLDDYEKFFSADSPYAIDHSWQAFVVTLNGESLAQGILTWRKGTTLGNLGFLDWVHDEKAAVFLQSQIEAFCSAAGLTEIKTPVDLNFFIKYRIKSPGGGEAFFGEPIYPDYYHELFKVCGYSVIGSWDTYQLNVMRVIRSYFKKNTGLKKKYADQHQKIKIRNVKLSQWDTELGIVHDLFNRSFSQMSEYQSLSLEQFKIVYNNFKYFIHPSLAYIVEYKSAPVGFSISYPDPLRILASFKCQKMNWWKKLWLLGRLKMNAGTLLISYVGKVPGPQGEDIKGVQIKMTRRLSLAGFFMKKVLVCYQSPDSPSRYANDPDVITPYSTYVLYGKKLK